MDNEQTVVTLEDLGYQDFFADSRKALGLEGYAVARISAEYKNAYRVVNPEGEYLARVTGRQIFTARERADYPAVGDWVAIQVLDKENAVIHNMLARRTVLGKKYSDKSDEQIMAANVDTAFIVESVDRDHSLNRLERYLVLARQGGVEPVLVLNKIDLISREEADAKIAQVQARCGEAVVIPTSIVTAHGLEALAGLIKKGRTYCFLGSSGVGKSSLINHLFGEDIARTGEIGRHSGRGRHVTTTRELFLRKMGGLLIDNPGARAVGLGDAAGGVAEVFGDIASLAGQCRYGDCTHRHEPGCAVLAALRSGEMDERRYENYIKLSKEAAHYAMTDVERRRKDRRFGRFVKKSLEQIEELGP